MSSIVSLIAGDRPDYPQILKKKGIPDYYQRIWTLGNLEILTKRLLGFFCSVKCPGNIILKTYDLARALRDAEVVVVSGFHSPIEKDCLDLLLRGTQSIVICPARGIENMRVPKPWRNALDACRLLIISPFELKHKRLTTELAEQRNRSRLKPLLHHDTSNLVQIAGILQSFSVISVKLPPLFSRLASLPIILPTSDFFELFKANVDCLGASKPLYADIRKGGVMRDTI